MFRSILALALIATISSATDVDAERGGRLRGGRRFGGPDSEGQLFKDRKNGLLEKYDANQDGKLDKAERLALYEAKKAKQRERNNERKAAFIAKYDKDGDGTLNDEERNVALSQGRWLRVGTQG